MRFRSDVQGLRAVAVVPVLLYHFGVAAVCGGFTGVDIFFVISGFVIAASILDDVRGGRFSIADFYFKRVRRIFPALGATMLVTTLAAVVILLPQDLVSYGWSLLATATFWSNVHFWASSTYFAPNAQLRPLLHTWSLSIEEQFYVLAPAAFALIHRRGGARWMLFLLPVALASFALAVAAVFHAPSAGFYLLPTRMWELLVGAVVALRARPAPRSVVLRELLSVIGLALVLTGLFAVRETDPFPGWNALLPCLGAALILQSGLAAERLPLVGRALSTVPFQWIGNISYSLYLVHWPIVAFYRYTTLRQPDAIAAATMLAASVALAALSWRFVEQPWRHVDRRFRARTLLGGASMMAAVVAVALFGIRSRGLPSRFPGYVRQAVPGNGEWGGAHCFNMQVTRPLDWDAVACTRIHGGRGRILLWGDSFAAQYVPGILRDARRIDADVLQYTFAGCPPIFAFYSYGSPGCAASNAAVPALVRRQRVDTVVLAALWSEVSEHNLRQLYDTVARLRGMGLRVFVIGQSPVFVTDVQQIDYVSGNGARPDGASWPIASDPAIDRLIANQARRGGGGYIDPLGPPCRMRTCPYRIGRRYLYFDYGHMSTLGSTIAVRRYFPAGAPRANR